MEVAQSEWLSEVSGLAIAKAASDQRRSKKQTVTDELARKLEPMKEQLRQELTVILKTGLISRIKTLDESGGQMDEFDIIDLPDVKNLTPEVQKQLIEAMAKIDLWKREALAEMVEIVNEKGEKEVVPLFDDDSITEDIYMPLVRERILPEWMVTDKFSKTQQMINASDKLYQERLEEYTKSLTEEEQSLLDEASGVVGKLGSLAQKAVAMVPFAEADTAKSIIGLVTLGTQTTLTGAKMLTTRDWQGPLDGMLDNMKNLLSQSLTLALGGETGNLAGQLFGQAVTGIRIAKCLTMDPPSIDGAIDAIAGGISDAFGAVNSLDKNALSANPVVSQAISKSVTQLFRSAASAVRLKTHVDNADFESFVTELSKVADQTLKTTQSIVTEALKENKPEDAQKLIESKQKELTEQISKGLQILEKTAKVGKKMVDAAKRKDIHAFAQDIVDGIGGVLSGVVATFDADAGKRLANAYTTTTSIGMVGYYLSLDPPDKSKALSILGKGLSESFTMMSPSDENLKQVGSLLNSTFCSVADGVDIQKMLADGDYAGALRKLSAISKRVVSEVFKSAQKEDAEESGDETGDEDSETLDTELADKIQKSIGNVSESVAGCLQKMQDEEAQAELERKINELRSADALSSIESSQESIERLLIQGDESGTMAAETRSIENLIKVMVRDRMIMEMAFKVVSAGAAVVEQFVAPMAIGSAAIKLAENLIKAANRAMHLNTWIANQKDMQRAVSSFETSAQNFVKNQAEQFSHYSIRAALELARMIGEIVNCSGLATAAGQAVSKSAALALQAEEISYQFYKKADLEIAWRMTRKAWDHPESRKLQLKARQMNPTLAKYTLAWGAVVKKDALCQEAMSTCGLNALTLSHKNSNVANVQRYLETYFNEDNVVLKRYAPPDWMPASLELNAKSWGTAKSRAEKIAKIAVVPTGDIDEAFAQLPELQQAFENQTFLLKEDPESVQMLSMFESAYTAHVTNLEHLVDGLRRYRSKCVDAKTNDPNAEMISIVDEYSELILVAIGEAEASHVELMDLGLVDLFAESQT